MTFHKRRSVRVVKPLFGFIGEAIALRKQFWARVRGTTWQRNLIVLWIGELIAISGFSVTLPFLPYYVQELGITELDRVAFWAGLLTTAQSTTMAIVAPLWGLLADRYGRKIMVVRAMLGGAVIISLMGVVQNVHQLLILRAIQGMLTGTVPAATTLIASSTPSHRRGYALGMLQMAIYLGSTVGPFLGGLVADNLGYRATFWVTGGLLFVAGVLTAALVREEFTPPERGGTRMWEGLLLVLRTRALMTLYGVRMLLGMAAQIVGPVFSLFVQSISSPDAKVASLAGTIAGLASLTGALSAVFLGQASDRVGSRRILLLSSAASGVLYALMAGARTPAQLGVLRALAGISAGGILASVSALQASLAPTGRYGAVYGVNTSLMAAANAVSPMIGATLAASWGLPSVFFGAAAIYGLGTAVAALVLPGSVTEAEKHEQSPSDRGEMTKCQITHTDRVCHNESRSESGPFV
jgi:DHA1 family multidrug resistance protein-like MFS transporter